MNNIRNILLSLFAFSVFGSLLGCYWIIVRVGNGLYVGYNIILIAVIALLLHYCMNIVHMASHNIFGRKLSMVYGNLAAILSGLTLADFRSTHQLHHAHLGDKQKDPDEMLIAHTPNWLIPFNIWKHDWFFFYHGLYKKQRQWVGYTIDRMAQIVIISVVVFTGFGPLFLEFWLLPLLLVALGNGLFLFYFPHYMTVYEKRLRSKTRVLVHESWVLWVIDISRIYHEKHHEMIKNVQAYFPLIAFVRDVLSGCWVQMQAKERKYVLNKA